MDIRAAACDRSAATQAVLQRRHDSVAITTNIPCDGEVRHIFGKGMAMPRPIRKRAFQRGGEFGDRGDRRRRQPYGRRKGAHRIQMKRWRRMRLSHGTQAGRDVGIDGRTVEERVNERDMCAQTQFRRGIETRAQVADQRFGLRNHQREQGATHEPRYTASRILLGGKSFMRAHARRNCRAEPKPARSATVSMSRRDPVSNSRARARRMRLT